MHTHTLGTSRIGPTSANAMTKIEESHFQGDEIERNDGHMLHVNFFSLMINKWYPIQQTIYMMLTRKRLIWLTRIPQIKSSNDEGRHDHTVALRLERFYIMMRSYNNIEYSIFYHLMWHSWYGRIENTTRFSFLYKLILYYS